MILRFACYIWAILSWLIIANDTVQLSSNVIFKQTIHSLPVIFDIAIRSDDGGIL